MSSEFSAFLIGALCSALIALLLAIARVIIPSVRRSRRERREDIERVLIYGAGSAGRLALDEIKLCRPNEAYAVGFIDDNARVWKEVRDGVRILGGKDMIEEIVRQKDITEIVIAINGYPIEDLQELQNNLKAKGLKPKFNRFPTTMTIAEA